MRSQPSHRRSARKRYHTNPADDEDASTTSSAAEAVEMFDLEKTVRGTKTDSTEANLMRELNHYDVVSTIYHWSSVDIGIKCWNASFLSTVFFSRAKHRVDLCLGCNWLHNVRPGRAENPGEPDLPQGERVWSWLILCDDSKNLAIHNGPIF